MGLRVDVIDAGVVVNVPLIEVILVVAGTLNALMGLAILLNISAARLKGLKRDCISGSIVLNVQEGKGNDFKSACLEVVLVSSFCGVPRKHKAMMTH